MKNLIKVRMTKAQWKDAFTKYSLKDPAKNDSEDLNKSQTGLVNN